MDIFLARPVSAPAAPYTFLQPFNSFLPGCNMFLSDFKYAAAACTHAVVIAISHTVDRCAGSAAVTELQVLMYR